MHGRHIPVISLRIKHICVKHLCETFACLWQVVATPGLHLILSAQKQLTLQGTFVPKAPYAGSEIAEGHASVETRAPQDLCHSAASDSKPWSCQSQAASTFMTVFGWIAGCSLISRWHVSWRHHHDHWHCGSTGIGHR